MGREEGQTNAGVVSAQLGLLSASEGKGTRVCLSSFFLIYIYINLFYLFLAALGLRCCAGAFSSCGVRGLLFLAVRGFLIVVASFVVAHGLQ